MSSRKRRRPARTRKYDKKSSETYGNFETLDQLQLPEALTEHLRKTWVDPSSARPSRKQDPNDLSADQLVKLATAPLDEVETVKTLADLRRAAMQRPMFFYKFFYEMPFHQKPWHVTHSQRPWHEIKEELEKRDGLKMAPRHKRHFDVGSYIAYHESDFLKIKRRSDIFATRKHPPISAHEIIDPGDRLVIGRFPARNVRRIYKEVEVVRFHDDMSEQQRLDSLFGGGGRGEQFPGATAADYHDGPPPPGYRCHNCQAPGHWRRHCTNPRRLAPTGIPKTFLETKSNHSPHEPTTTYTLANGRQAQLKLNNANINLPKS